jgi:hypothetical protein
MGRTRPASLVPAAARGDSRLTDGEVDRSASAIEAFTTALGGRAALVDAISVVDSDADADKLVGLLLDPTYDSWSLRRICTLAGITVAEVFALYKKAAIVRAHIQAAPVIASKLVGVVDDIMTRAQPYPIPCDRCGGTGRWAEKPTQEPGPCPTCRGGGTLMAFPDLDRQRRALELGQLTARGGGIVVQQNLIGERAGSAAPGALEQLQQALGDLLFRPAPPAPPVVDATLVETPPGETTPDPAPPAVEAG